LVRVAALLADADAGSVCLVDANLSAPILHTYLGASNRYGLSDVLIGPCSVGECVQQLSGRLHLLSSGSMALRAESMLGSSAFRLHMDELRASFDFVLFDTPPLATSYDALVVASRSDGLAMVVEANSTNRDIALKAAKNTALANVRMLGVVLNKRTYPIPRSIFNKL
jgi:Mrp family chromosome partitioning ATPase